MRRTSTAWLTIVLLALATAARAETRPNIVLILADDVGCDALGCYGGESYQTPHIDALAASGMRFTHCYSMPSCHPSRTTLLTGRYPRRLGRPDWGSFPTDEESNTLAQLAQRAGYATAVAGKWQLALLGDDLEQPHRLGFEHYALFGWHEGPRYYQPLIYEDGRRRDDVKDAFGPDVYSDVLIEFIQRNKEQPFFAYYPMALCHDVTDDLDEPVPVGPRGRYDYFGEMVAAMDRVVGKLTAALDDLALRERTLILFTGDNGTPQRSIVRAVKGKYQRKEVYSLRNGRWVQGGKTLLTDGGTNVPLIANWPGTIDQGIVADDLIDFSDFLPTVVELTDGRLPDDVTLDGASFAGRLLRGEPGPRTWAYAESPKGYWVRDRKFKLYDDGRYFDIPADPREQQPLDSSQLTAEAAAAHSRLQTALQSVSTFDKPQS